jgi:hypothetical protein
VWIVDYKTGTVSKDWQGERPWEPQLPVYAIALQAQKDVAGIAFYALKDNDNPTLQGLARDDVPLPKKEKSITSADWQIQLAQWQATLQTLADDFRAGVAVADPIINSTKNACTYCHLGLLCRNSEWLGVEDEVGEESA